MILHDELTYERVGNTWLFSDGTVLPVVAGADGDEPDPAAAGPDAGTDADPFDNAETATFDRPYVEKLRNEAAGYRTRAKDAEGKLTEYEDVFGNIDPEDRKVWLGMAKKMYEDPAAGAKWLADVAAHVQSGLTQEEAEAAAGAEPEGNDKPMTAADFDRLYKERRDAETAAQQQEASIKSITDEATELGYKDGTVDFDLLLGIALKQTNGDLKAADQVIKDARQAVIDEYVDEMRQAGGASQPPAGGLPPAGGEARQIKSLKDSDAAAKARLAAMAEGAAAAGERGGRRHRH